MSEVSFRIGAAMVKQAEDWPLRPDQNPVRSALENTEKGQPSRKANIGNEAVEKSRGPLIGINGQKPGGYRAKPSVGAFRMMDEANTKLQPSIEKLTLAQKTGKPYKLDRKNERDMASGLKRFIDGFSTDNKDNAESVKSLMKLDDEVRRAGSAIRIGGGKIKGSVPRFFPRHMRPSYGVGRW